MNLKYNPWKIKFFEFEFEFSLSQFNLLDEWVAFVVSACLNFFNAELVTEDGDCTQRYIVPNTMIPAELISEDGDCTQRYIVTTRMIPAELVTEDGDYTQRSIVTTRIIPALRLAAMTAILLFP